MTIPAQSLVGVPWYLVIDYDKTGYTVGNRLVCDTCWLTHTEMIGRTRFGSTRVERIRKLDPDDACYHCDQHPTIAPGVPA